MKHLFSIIFSVLSILAMLFFVKPLYTDISLLRESVKSYDTALTHSTELQKTRDSLVSAYNAIPKDNKERIMRFLPNSVDNIQLILEIQQMAGEHNMVIKNIDFTPPENSESKVGPDGRPLIQTSTDPNMMKPYGTFTISFKTEAKYADFISFLKEMETNLRLVDVKSVNFAVPVGDRADISPDLYEYDIKLDTYWLKH